MVRKFILSLTLILSVLTASAQVSLSQEDLNKLPKDVQKRIEMLEFEKKTGVDLVEYAGYASLGQQIGEAVNGTLKAVEDSAIRISETQIGKTAVAIVVWKVLYREVVGIVVGTIMLIIGIIFLFKGASNMCKEEGPEGSAILPVLIGAVSCGSAMIAYFA